METDGTAVARGCSPADEDGAEMEQFVKEGGNLALIILPQQLCDTNILQMCVLWHKCTKWWLPLRKREQGVSLSGGAGAGGAERSSQEQDSAVVESWTAGRSKAGVRWPGTGSGPLARIRQTLPYWNCQSRI